MRLTKEDSLLAMKDLGALAKEIREDRGLRQIDAARAIGLGSAQMSQLENGKLGFRSQALQIAIESDFYTEEERKFLRAKFDNMNPGDNPVGQNRDQYRIKNIPGFYEDLDALGDIHKLDKNDPRLQALRLKLGLDPVMTGKVSADYK